MNRVRPNGPGSAHQPDRMAPLTTVLASTDGRQHACAAVARGWSVFPVRPGDKRPAVQGWENRACSDPGLVARYWPSEQHNVGIACGPSGLVVIDLDTHGELPADWQLPGITDGRDVLAQLAEWAGQPWPATYSVTTPSGGLHLYYTAPAGITIRNSAGKIGPLIDVRSQGGYVVAAGSVVGARAYELADDCTLAMLPAWLRRLLTGQAALGPAPAGRPPSPGGHRRLAAICATVAQARVGQRNASLYWGACRAAEVIAARQADAPTVTEALVAAATAAGLPEQEARRTIASGLKGEDR